MWLVSKLRLQTIFEKCHEYAREVNSHLMLAKESNSFNFLLKFVITIIIIKFLAILSNQADNTNNVL